MAPTRRIYRRVTTTERIVLQPEESRTGPIHGDAFRVEIFVKDGAEEKLVYEREHTGRVDVEEMDGGNFLLSATAGPNRVED